jgi:hypothetical protein
MSKNPEILNVIHHRQNSSGSTINVKIHVRIGAILECNSVNIYLKNVSKKNCREKLKHRLTYSRILFFISLKVFDRIRTECPSMVEPVCSPISPFVRYLTGQRHKLSFTNWKYGGRKKRRAKIINLRTHFLLFSFI